jgi:hypothetical protein
VSGQQRIARGARQLTSVPLETACRGCRSGLVCSEPWQGWYARLDEAEAAFQAAHEAVHDILDGFWSSAEAVGLLDARPELPEEVECPDCVGTGLVLTDAGREVLAWARRRLDDQAA